MNKAFFNICRTLRFRLYNLYNVIFNEVVRKQTKDYKTIPILIISYNQLLHLKQLVEFLWNNNYRNIVIIDNNSSYKPLLEYLNYLKKKITVYELKENYGYRVFWKKRDLFSQYTQGYYVITDPDVIPIEDCPADFLQHFRKILDKNPQIDKVGFSLDLSNIPDTNSKKSKILLWEEKYWKNKDKEGNFIAEIDTTFALYRPGNPFVTYKGIRTNYPYSAYHRGWEIDSKNLTREQKFYIQTANSSSSWNKSHT